MNHTEELIHTYLTASCTEPLRDPVWGTVLLPKTFMELILLPEFQKLSRIRQLGPTYLLYPGAVHTRLSHSIGVFAIARKILISLLQKQNRATGLPWTLTGVKSFLAAALLHDIGHFPYTHSLKDLPLESHETLAARIILERKEVFAVLEKTIGASAGMTAAIIDGDQPGEDRQTAAFRSILSGTLDPDKLDYLNRDAFFCGVPYGLQDVDFILTKLKLTGDDRMGIQERGIGSIEHLLFAKYLMYRNVYWHSSVRSATAMIRKALYTGLREGLIKPSDLYQLDDQQFIQKFSASKYSFCTPIDLAAANRLYPAVLTLPQSSLTSELQNRLRSQEFRYTAEERLRRALNREHNLSLNPWEVIVDIPEPISFESDVPVELEDGTVVKFPEAGPVFTKPVIDGFTQNLSKIRLFTPRQLSIDKDNLLEYLS
ncbi:MAG: HD domain-containing protein [Spirochaetales bacterium]|jgi:HD superfamily phosphohydrolase|nr:HD domain-containing protein [Spirochaetales bacterium]